MSDALVTIQRLITLDEQMRQRGQQPYAQSVYRILNVILKHDVLQDERVREWVVARASTTDYRIGSAILKLGLALVRADFAHDALRIAKSVVESITDGNRAELGKRDYSHLRELDMLLSQPALIVTHPTTWGHFIIDLQSAALYGHREAEWPQTQEFRRHWNEKCGDVYVESEEFTPEYDDQPDIWYYQHGHLDRDLRGTLSRTIEKALAEAIRLPKPNVFRALTELLVQSKWAVSSCQVLATVYDFVRAMAQSQCWQCEKAVSLVADFRFERLNGPTNFRRLLRHTVKGHVAQPRRDAIIECIRLHAPSDTIRINELADLEDWGLLTQEESAKVERMKSEDNLFDPYDPREAPWSTVSFAHAAPREDELTSRWPHAEDHLDVKLLLENRPPPDAADRREVEEWLMPRIEALKTIAEREESYDAQWFGEVTSWCERVLEVLKRWMCQREATGGTQAELIPDAYLASLNRHAPWWRQRTEACIDRIGKNVPEHHHKEEEGHLVWSPNDSLYAELSFLDELLAIEHCRELAPYREKLATALASQWNQWPPFTQATALTVLRPFHWASIAPLRALLNTVVEEDRHSDILERSLHHALRFGSSDIVGVLKRVWNRIETVSNPAETALFIGTVIGNAAMRYRGDGEETPVLAELTAWCEQLRNEPSDRHTARGALVHGILWAAKKHAENAHELTSRHADAWLELAQWGAREYLDTRTQVEGRASTLQAVTFVLEMPWPPAERRRLYEELGDIFERVIREGNVGEFSMLHFELTEEIGQQRSGDKTDAHQRRDIAPTDNLLLRLCRASAERVAEWRRKGETTRDLGYGVCLWGGDTGDLIELVFLYARDREYVRRELSPIIDILASAELTTLATDLRMKIRRR